MTPVETESASDAGQAMAEYALLITFVSATLMIFLPDFINALQNYYDSFYIILNLPIP